MNNDATEWLATIPTPRNRSSAARTLSAPMRLDGGPIRTRAQHVQDLVSAGATVDLARMRVELPDGSFYDGREISDAAVCFAEWLVNRPEEVPCPSS